MNQPLFVFDDQPVDPSTSSPTGQPGPPVNGSGPLSRHASWTGAVFASKARGEKVAALRQLLVNHGPMTMNTAATITGWPLSSICSLKAALGAEVVAVDVELEHWGDGRTTTRTRWGIQK